MELTLTPGLSVALPLILSSALAALGLLVVQDWAHPWMCDWSWKGSAR